MNQRDLRIDLLRGLAIFTMIAANMAAHSLAEPHGVFMRFYGSLAAPLFIFLSGMMVAYTAHRKTHPFGYYLKRGAMIVLIAALIDVFLWGTVPFTTFDVLYIIGVSMPLLYFFLKLPDAFKLMLIVVIVILTPVFQFAYGYQAYPTEENIFPFPAWEALRSIPIGQQWLIDGWFPVFPWLAVSMFGALIGQWQEKMSALQFDRLLLGIGSTLFTLGALAWVWFQPALNDNEAFNGSPMSLKLFSALLTREGYSELFYPPTLFYLFTFIGFILILLALIRRLQRFKILHFLSVYGRSSLLVYILHTVFIVFIFNRLESYEAGMFLLLYGIHATVLWGICFSVQKATTGKKLPFLLRFVLGG
jgi:uncharacterized membrane protein